MKATKASECRTGGVQVGVYAAMPEGGQPGWIELIPAGTFHGRDGRGPYRLGEVGGVIAATQALQMDAGLPIDYDHATDLGAPAGRPAPAAGWIKELGEREGALWGRVEWTQHGAAALATREYRYVSPVFEHDSEGVVERLLRAALTNNPNLYLKAIAARVEGNAGGHAEAGGAGDTANKAGMQMAELLAALREILALESEATPEEIVEAARRQAAVREGQGVAADEKGRSDAPDRGRYVAFEHYEKASRELSVLRAQRAREDGERAVEQAMRAGKIVPAQRDWAIEYCTADAAGFAQFVARQPALALGALELEGSPRRRKQAEGAAAALVADGALELSTIETAICARLGLRATDYARRKMAQAESGSELV
ncbi:MAG: phage protease [Candidatus Binataceae bacterium]